jgi:hypothetical protein
MCHTLELLSPTIKTSDDDDRIWLFLGHVFVAVRHALQKDPKLEAYVSTEDEFKENLVNHEKEFINLLRETARKESWRELLNNGTSFLRFDLKCSDRVLSLDVFRNKKVPKENLSEAAVNGAQ